MYYRLNRITGGPEAVSLEEWAEGLRDLSSRVVAVDDFPYAKVSTVFLGLDHRFGAQGPPILFETMVFGGGNFDQYQERYCTREEALAGHRRILEMVTGLDEPKRDEPIEVRPKKDAG